MPFRLRAKKSPATATGDESSDAHSQLNKAQLRRAQVRKAQIQHRQRKANYVKQLEVDISKLRDLISGTERDASALRGENEAMRTRIRDAVGQLSLPLDQPAENLPGLSEVAGLDGITMELDFDNVLNAPSYRIASSPSEGSSDVAMGLSPCAYDHGHAQGSRQEAPALPKMSPEQTQLAINFILA